MTDIALLGLEVRSDGVVVASDRLKRLSQEGRSAESSTNSLAASTDKLAGYLKAAAAALATWKLAEYIKDATMLAARVETLGVVLKVVGNNAGYTGTQMQGFVDQVKRMGITTQESMNSLIKMAGAQMDLTKAAQLARVAQDAAVIGNINSSEAFGRLIQGIRSGEVEILKTIGINVQFEQGYKQTAATLGKTSDALTAAEKTASRMNQVLQFGTNIAGAYEASMGTAGKQMLSLSRYTEELKLKIGETFTPSLTFIIGEITGALKGMDAQISANKDNVATFGDSFKIALVSIAAEIQRVSMVIDLAGGSLTAFASRALKVAEVTTRFITIGQFGDWLKEKSEEMAKSNSVMAQRYAEGEAELQRLANLTVPGATPSTVRTSAQEQATLAAATTRKEQEAAESRKIAADSRRKASEAEAVAAEKWAATYAGLRREITGTDAALSEHDSAIQSVMDKYDGLMEKKGADILVLRILRGQQLEAVDAYYKQAEAMKEALAIQDAMTAAWEGEPQSRSARDQMQGQLSVQLAEQQGLRQEALKLQIEMENAALREKGIYEGQVKELKDKSDAIRVAVEAQKEADQLTALRQENRDIATSLMSNPFEQEKQALRDKFDYQKELLKQELQATESNSKKGAEIVKKYLLLEQKHIQDTAKVDTDSQRAKLYAVSYYTAMAGDLFAQLASAQDQSSRKGFETAKDYSMAAATVSTAAAVMNALSTVQPYPAAVAAAASAAATGAIQISKIESTSFGGGSGTVSAPSGSFTAGGSGNTGASIGKPYATVHQSQDSDTMQRLADSMENASVEMRRVADGLVSFQDVLNNEAGKRQVEGAPNRFMDVSAESSWLHKFGSTIMDSLGFESTKFIREGNWGGLFKQLRDFSLSAGGGLLGNALWGQGNKWQTTGGGVSLAIEDGDVMGQSYIDRKKSGGLLKSSKKKTEYSTIDEGFAYWLANTIGDVKYATNLASGVLGTTANVDSVSLAATKIKTSGKSPEEIQEELEKWMQSVGNAFAKTVEGLEEFAQPGEEAFATLMRLSISLQTVNDSFLMMGKTLLDSSLASGNFASKLVDLMGGVEQFNESMDTYFTRMFTEAEQEAGKLARAQTVVTASFREMGVMVPSSTLEFRNLVNSLDVTTESGAQLFAALMEVAPAFADMVDLTEELAKATRDFNNDLNLRIKRLNGEDTSLYELRIQQQEEWEKAVENGMDLQKLRIVQDREWARAVAEVTGDVSNAIEDMVSSAKSAVLDMIDAQIAIGKARVSISTGPLANLSPEAAYLQSKAAFEALIGKTDLASLQKLPGAAQDFLNASKGYNASGSAYQMDYEKVLKVLDTAMGLNPGGGVDQVQTQIDLLGQIKTAIENGSTETVDQLAALLGPNSTLAGLIGTWSDATQEKLEQEKQTAATETFIRELGKYTEAVKPWEEQYKAGKITTDEFKAQAGSLYAPVANAWSTATAVGADVPTSGQYLPLPTRDAGLMGILMNQIQHTELPVGMRIPWTYGPDGKMVEWRYETGTTAYGDGGAEITTLDNMIGTLRWLEGTGQTRFAAGGYYHGGSALMGEYGPELVDSSPGFVYRADETKALFAMAKRGVADNYTAELITEIRELRREVAELKGTAETGNRIAAAVGSRLEEVGQEGNRQRSQVVKGERMRGAA